MGDNDWTLRAHCRGEDPNIFFPKRGEALDPRADEHCNACSVTDECLDTALRTHTLGRWAKTSPHDRMIIRRQRKMEEPGEEKFGTA
jgi:hypothetical protein